MFNISVAKTIFFIADFKALVFWLESLERNKVRLYIGEAEDSSDRNSLTALSSAQASLLPRTLGREGEMTARDPREGEMKENAYYYFYHYYYHYWSPCGGLSSSSL